MKPSLRIIVSLVFVLLLCAGHSLALMAPGGSVKGKITDVTTGEALPGVNVLIVGSGRGAVTDGQGEYFITNVNPGSYVLRISLLGYQTIESRKFDVKPDETLVLNFKLAGTDIEMEGITVVGQAPLVDVMKTAGDQTFSSEKIDQLPNVKGVEDVLGLQAGVVKFGGQLFLRGGRANETQILIDGVVVNDVGSLGSGSGSGGTANEQLQQLYSGNSSGGAGGALSVAANAIQSVSVSSSGLDAEFGNAQSGVVSITTKSGGDSYTGSLQYRTDGPTSSSYNERYYAGNVGGPEPITSYLLPSIGLNVPGKLSIFVSGNFTQQDGAFNFNTAEFYNPTKRRIRIGGLFGDLLKGIGFNYNDRQSNQFTFNTKLNYTIGESDQFTYSYRANAGTERPFYGRVDWRDRADSVLSVLSLVTQDVLQWTHILGTNSLVKGYISRLETDRTLSVAGLIPPQYTHIDRRFRDLNGDGILDLGIGDEWTTRNTAIWNAKFDYSSQIHKLHFLKAGFEYFYEHERSTSILDPGIRDETFTRGEFPGFGDARHVTDVTPSRGAFFVQDNIEFGSINVKVGLRYDWFYLGKQVFDPDWVSRWESIVGEKASWLENKSFMSQFTRGYVSPRLAIGYPISTSTVFYFNYGHFLQYPERGEIYWEPILKLYSDPNRTKEVGNPSLKPQKTVQYEAGFDQLIFEDLSLGIRGFYKDIFDYVATKEREKVNLKVNLDYASARGFEIIINKQLRNRYSGSLGYTFQLAKGRTSDRRSDGSSAGLPREVRLSWDQQHTINLFLGYRVGPKEDFDLFGLNFNNWGASVTWSFGSGFPYTPFDPNVLANTLQDQYLRNTGNGPHTSELNLSIFKGFSIIAGMSLTFSIDVTNLLNRRNVDLNAGGFNRLLGRTILYGDSDPGSRRIYGWNSFGSRVPPYVFQPGRQIAFGLKLNWD